jgi:hypothetical protein
MSDEINEGGYTHLLFIVPIGDCQEALSEKHLEFFDKEILRIVDADECADDITGLVSSKVYRPDQPRPPWQK